MLERIKELESKIQDRHPRNQLNSYVGQIHNVDEVYEDDHLEQGVLHDEKTLEGNFGNPSRSMLR